MHQECRAPVHVGAQQAQTFIGRIPGFNDNVIQFVAEEIFDHTLVSCLYFEEVGQHTRRSQATLHHSGLKKAAHRFGRISMFRNHRFERASLADGGRIFGAQAIQMTLALGFFRPLGIKRMPGQRQFLGKRGDSLGNAFKLQT